MKQFLSSKTCLSCEGCCRFAKEKSEWRAKVGICEEKNITNIFPLDHEGFKKTITDSSGYLKNKLCGNFFCCMFFDPDDHRCAIYHNRPFECSLYPFVLTLSDDTPSVSVHLFCPHIQNTIKTKTYAQYISYLKEIFKRNEIKELLRSNPFLFGDYLKDQAELELVFHINDI